MKEKFDIKDEPIRKEKHLMARVPLELWYYIKRSAIDDDTSMSAIITEWMIKYKIDREKRLTTRERLLK